MSFLYNLKNIIFILILKEREGGKHMEWIDWVILLCSWAMHLNKGPACYLREAWLGDFPMNADLNFFYSWIVIKDDKIFSLLFKRNPWMKSWIKHYSWTILFCVMNLWLLQRAQLRGSEAL